MSSPGPEGMNPDIHLQRLLAADVEVPWYRSFFKNIKDAIRPPKLPPLEVTSTPVPVEDIWNLYRPNKKRAGISSLAIHVGVIGLLVLLGTNKTVQQAIKEKVALIAPDIAAYQPPKKTAMGGGGGGGDRSPIPVSKGKLPKLAMKQFVPPMIPVNEHPKLVMDPTLIIQPDANIPKLNMDQIGDPLARSGIASNGTGGGGGMGSGSGGGIGPGRGPGYGFGADGDLQSGARVFRGSPQGEIPGHRGSGRHCRRQGKSARPQGHSPARTRLGPESHRGGRKVAIPPGDEGRTRCSCAGHHRSELPPALRSS